MSARLYLAVTLAVVGAVCTLVVVVVGEIAISYSTPEARDAMAEAAAYETIVDAAMATMRHSIFGVGGGGHSDATSALALYASAAQFHVLELRAAAEDGRITADERAGIDATRLEAETAWRLAVIALYPNADDDAAVTAAQAGLPALSPPAVHGARP